MDAGQEQSLPKKKGGRTGTRSRYQQGYFKPKHPEKYKGDVTKIRFLSSWERRLFEFCDGNPHVIEWSSEEIIIPYVKPTDGQIHRYFPDVWVKYKDRSGRIVEEILEIKPEKETKPPTRRTKHFLYEQVTWAINEAKWRSALEWCKQRNIGFRLVTENSLFKN